MKQVDSYYIFQRVNSKGLIRLQVKCKQAGLACYKKRFSHDKVQFVTA